MRRGKKYVLVSKNGGKVLGVFNTKAQAEAQERAIQASKAKGGKR